MNADLRKSAFIRGSSSWCHKGFAGGVYLTEYVVFCFSFINPARFDLFGVRLPALQRDFSLEVAAPHGVSASYIKRMKERGYADLSLDEYIRLRNRGERE